MNRNEQSIPKTEYYNVGPGVQYNSPAINKMHPAKMINNQNRIKTERCAFGIHSVRMFVEC